MSTDELVKGIRRIVEQDEKPKGLGDADALKPIGISRGIAYIGSGGSVRGSGAEGGGNDTSPPDVPEPDTTPDEGVPDDGGGTGTDSDAGAKTELTGDAAVVNDAATQNSKITSATGTDPITGTLTSVNFDSKAGIEYVPPDGWNSPTEPGTVEEGRSYIGNIPGMREEYYDSVEGCFARYKEVDTRASSYSLNSSGSVCSNVGYWSSPGPAVLLCTYKSYQVFFSPSGSREDIFQVDTPSGETNITGNAQQPSDSVCSVTYDHDAQGYKGHELDPDCSTTQKTASNFVIIRSQSDPSRYFRYTRLADGGTKITEVDSGGTPVPSTITKIMDGAGNITGFVDVSLDNFYQ